MQLWQLGDRAQDEGGLGAPPEPGPPDPPRPEPGPPDPPRPEPGPPDPPPPEPGPQAATAVLL